VTTPDGAQVPLAQLAHIEVAPGQAAISREANMRFVGIKCNVRGRDLGGFVKEAQRKVAEARASSRRTPSSPGAASSRTSDVPWPGSPSSSR